MCLFQLRVRVYDIVYFIEIVIVIVNIGVLRNENFLVFGQNFYRIIINEIVGVGICILDVDVIDVDGVSLIDYQLY